MQCFEGQGLFDPIVSGVADAVVVDLALEEPAHAHRLDQVVDDAGGYALDGDALFGAKAARCFPKAAFGSVGLPSAALWRMRFSAARRSIPRSARRGTHPGAGGQRQLRYRVR